MNAFFRHLAVRSWLTVLAGGSLCLILLPWWQQVFGLHWLALPAFVTLGACFGAVGWIMNRMGSALALRQVNEAAVWERAGMIREAETAFQRSAALFDSFWLSAFYRRRKTRRLSGALARFHLSQSVDTPYARCLVASYLKHYPHDEAVAESWLEGLSCREQCTDLEHETVSSIGETLDRHKPIQKLIMQFYLANGRIDFDAQQTYRRVWKEQQPLEISLLHALARLLRHESIINPWALQVYLKAYQTGAAEVIDGIAAGLRILPFGEESRKDLVTAQQLVSGLDAEKVRGLAARFKPVEIEPTLKTPKRISWHWTPLGPSAFKVAGASLSAVFKWLQKLITTSENWRASFNRRHLLYALGLSGVIGLALLIAMSGRPSPEPSQPEPPDVQTVDVKPVVLDPFTIQVAAYLKSQDAQGFVDQLTQQKIDAYWTKATSANRTWYQVKVSHFPTREAAQKYGQGLKSKGLIDDFYVANYEPR
jgi:hypothetical protein